MRARRRALGCLGALLVVGAGLLVWQRLGGGAHANAVRHVVLISIDTCRADHLGCYGDTRGVTPRIDAFAREAVRFANVVSPVPMTLPAHASLLTGTNPPRHGSHDNLNYRVSADNVTLAEVLHEHGFTCGAVVSASVLDARFGLDQGFDTYDDAFEDAHKAVNITERRADETSRVAIEWLRRRRDQPFFLLLHYYDPHDPYEPPEPYASRFGAAPYAGEIAWVDECIGRVLDELRALDLYDSTLVVITADHGEMLGEHGERTHSYFIYQAALRVPLIVRLPGQSEGRVVDGLTGLVDVVPTICGLLGIELPSGVVGEDLSDVLSGRRRSRDERYVYCESVTPRTYQANPLTGLAGEGWQFIRSTRSELYDRASDPGQTTDVAARHPDRAAALADLLTQMVQREMRAAADNRIELDPRVRARLESIGYVGSAPDDGSSVLEQQPDLDDARDLIAFHNAFASVAGWLATGQYDQAERTCRRLVGERPGFLAGHISLARIAVEQNDLGQAEAHLVTALAIEPENAEALRALGFVLAARRQYAEAIEHYERSLAVRPDHAETHTNLGAALMATGQRDEAMHHHRRALELDPDLADAHVNLGLALFEQQNAAEAMTHYREALRIDPGHADAHHNLAVVLAAGDQVDAALEQYEQALAARPDHVEARVNLGTLLARRGETDTAAAHFRDALRAKPDYALAHYNLGLLVGARGQAAESIAHLREAIRHDPGYAKARFHLGTGLVADGQLPEALAQFREAARLSPDWAAPVNEAAWLMATRVDLEGGDGQEAVALAERAVRLSGGEDPALLDTLAAACAAAGQFARAQATAQRALEQARAAKRTALAEQIRARLALYSQGRAYREGR